MELIKHIIFQTITTKDQKHTVVGRLELDLPFTIAKDTFIEQAYYPVDGEYKVQSIALSIGAENKFSHIDVDMQIMEVADEVAILEQKEAFLHHNWQIAYCSLDDK